MGYKKDENRITISFSEISTWLNCAFQHSLKYIKGYSEPSNIVLVYGKAMHSALQALYTLSVSDSLELFQKELEDGANALGEYAPIEQVVTDYLVNGRELIRQYCKTPYARMENKGIEISLEQKILGERVFFKGFIDILLWDKKRNKYIIVDFKTTANGWTPSVKNDKVKRSQLLLYKYFILKNKRALGEDLKDSDVECVFVLLKGKKQQLDYVHVDATEEQCIKAFRFLLEVVKKIYVEKKTKYKNTSGCFFCYWKDSPECDRMSRRDEWVDTQQIVNIMI